MKKLLTGATAALLAASVIGLAAPAAATQGVSKNEIVVGTLQDLSGPIALLGTHFRNGTQMRFDEENAKGGIHGRRLTLVVEDSGYDPKKGVLATQKMLQRDKVFAMISNLGSPVVMATMPTILEKGVLHLFPAAPVPATYEPLHPLKFQAHPPYSTTVAIGARYLIQTNGYKKPGILYQDDDFGYDVLRGLEAALKEANLPLCEKVTYKRGATDFSSQVARLKAAGCDFLVLGTVVRETIGTMAEARKIGWDVPMLVSPAAYTAQIPQLGGKITEGLYGLVLTPHPYPDDANKQLSAWIAEYKKRFNSEPNTWSVLGYVAADIFVAAAQKAGPNLTAQSFAAALEGLNRTRDYFGSPNFSFSKTDHLGNRSVRIAQIRNGKWENITDYMK
ncbi:MAG: ABC transporter substrate-binding protein [Pseudomonadota bacterium]|jgi:ABC-type branched-subunit amino acid transport system substrate-binding protein